jgi:hypothetical protein
LYIATCTSLLVHRDLYIQEYQYYSVPSVVPTKAKHLVCEPFPINFRCTTKYVPAISDNCATICYIEFREVLSIIKKTNAYIAKVYAGATSASNKKVCSSEQHMPVEPESDSDSLTTISTSRSMIGRWCPPPSANNTPHDYHDNVFGENGYL